MTFVSLYSPKTPKTRYLVLVYTEALRRLGITFQFVDVPARRASLMVNQGDVDGELLRVAGYNAKYPNMVQVPERNYCFGHSAYSITVKEPVRAWKDMAGRGYRVGVVRGMRFGEDRLAELQDVTVEGVVDSNKGFEMLAAGRIDVFVTTQSQYHAFLNSEAGQTYARKQQSVGAISHIGTWDRQAVYAWLHKSNMVLLEPLANQLRDMRAEGLLDEFYDQVGLPQTLKDHFLCRD